MLCRRTENIRVRTARSEGHLPFYADAGRRWRAHEVACAREVADNLGRDLLKRRSVYVFLWFGHGSRGMDALVERESLRCGNAGIR